MYIMTRKLSTDPYKGVRDFYPEDMAVQNRIFGIWRSVCAKYGYEEVGASVLEPAELYKAKTGDEIINEQTYTFTDRGDREVTLRPEMTPSVARMVASRRRDLVFPLRWFSIPNLFRYEQPQRGRTREHWQLNVDIFGVDTVEADIEVINMACDITRAYGLKDADFEVRVNSRKLMDYVTRDVFGLPDDKAHRLGKIIDKKAKLSEANFVLMVEEVLGDEAKTKKLIALLNSGNFEEFTSNLPQTASEHDGLKEVRSVISGLEKLGIKNARFDQTLMRGFDYYTGTVFEIFDLNPANKRSVFGGGRYDDLLSLFGNDKVSAFGFGAGDLIARDLMETYGTLPKADPAADVAICVMGANAPYALDLAQALRAKNMRVSVDFSGKKVGDKISGADKRGIPKVIVIGDEETKTGKFKVKTLSTGEERTATAEDF